MVRALVVKLVSVFLFSALLLVACDGNPVVERRVGKKENSQKGSSVLQAADLAGYDGALLRKNAGALMDAKSRHNQAIQSALDGGEQPRGK